MKSKVVTVAVKKVSPHPSFRILFGCGRQRLSALYVPIRRSQMFQLGTGVKLTHYHSHVFRKKKVAATRLTSSQVNVPHVIAGRWLVLGKGRF